MKTIVVTFLLALAVLAVTWFGETLEQDEIINPELIGVRNLLLFVLVLSPLVRLFAVLPSSPFHEQGQGGQVSVAIHAALVLGFGAFIYFSPLPPKDGTMRERAAAPDHRKAAYLFETPDSVLLCAGTMGSLALPCERAFGIRVGPADILVWRSDSSGVALELADGQQPLTLGR